MKNNINESQILGSWFSEDGFLKMEIYKLDNEEFRGKVLWVDEEKFERSGPLVDSLNPEPALRERSLIGMEFITGLKFNSRKGEWKDGKMYDPQEGKSYHVKIWPQNIDQISVRPSLDALSMLGETFTWHRMS